ncbi:Glucose-6-phosphate dehydrogenase [Thermocrinis albus DSM 14484]|uniref:Glucose-6-phosphate 1-dehydrogenase n=1 Tax=Thermocrinis albus (strain DSM 14484 / JCM 11386 / HI 11/12) TaxID=638303 RepID=D3SN77_THEAH|nr:glucose-6-phosphate dehydrogenase [Thermocrinis albus]ADC90207.1 Glucose-6-phosphate dehydrogenase [Thermocrinis albus DSM 14484]
MADDTVFFILGGTGDLARKKLLPALARLIEKGKKIKAVYSLARSSREDWEKVACSFSSSAKALCKFMPFDVRSKESYQLLAKELSSLKGKKLIFYLALPPSLFEDAVRNLGIILRNFTNPRSIVIEKPFGYDLTSARKLNSLLKRYFVEEEIFRIDHFLGKDTVQNIFSLRFSNILFEGVWNRNFVDNVQILALEDTGVEGREGYYDSVGAVRDMLQNHLLQILTFTAMEPPCCMEQEAIRDEKVKLLKNLSFVSFVKGQYIGYPVKGSRTETFVLAKAYVDNLRWQDVPFYLMTGKKLARRLTQITVVFRKIPKGFMALLDCMPRQNRVVFQVSPESKIKISIELRPPNWNFMACPIETTIEHSTTQGVDTSPYETLLEDIMEGDQSLFIRDDEVEALWQKVEPLLQDTSPPLPYPQGVELPHFALEFLKNEQREWYL